MAFRIGNRVISAIGLLLILFFVTSSVAHLLTQRVKDDVFRLVGVDDRKPSAAVDLRAQLDAFARTAVAYAYGRDATGREQAGQSKDRLGRAASRLSRLATTGEERKLVREFNALFEDFVSQGNQVIAIIDRERAEIVALRANAQALVVAVDEQVERSELSGGAPRKREALHTIRSLEDRITSLSFTSAVQRVHGELLKIAKPDPMNPGRQIIDNMPRHMEIASWAGTTPNTVAHANRRLVEANVVKRSVKTLHILDPERPKALVDGELRGQSG